MILNEFESSEMLKQKIQLLLLYHIQKKIQNLYKDHVLVGYVERFHETHPCLYLKKSLSRKILFFNLNKIEKRVLVEVSVNKSDNGNFSEITAWIMDDIIYFIVKDDFERFGNQHESSIDKLNIIKNYGT